MQPPITDFRGNTHSRRVSGGSQQIFPHRQRQRQRPAQPEKADGGGHGRTVNVDLRDTDQDQIQRDLDGPPQQRRLEYFAGPLPVANCRFRRYQLCNRIGDPHGGNASSMV